MWYIQILSALCAKNVYSKYITANHFYCSVLQIQPLYIILQMESLIEPEKYYLKFRLTTMIKEDRRLRTVNNH
jgi:hypothetical protein